MGGAFDEGVAEGIWTFCIAKGDHIRLDRAWRGSDRLFATRPAISESILDTITLEDGHYSLDGLRAGMTRDEVAAHLDDRKLVYFDGQPTVYLLRGSVETASGTTWISLSDETRVKELGRVTVRRTYYFQDGLFNPC